MLVYIPKTKNSSQLLSKLVLQNDFSILAQENHFFQQVCFHHIISWHTESAFYGKTTTVYAFITYKATFYYLLHPWRTATYQETELLWYYLCVTEGQYEWRAKGWKKMHLFTHERVCNVFPNQKCLRNQSVVTKESSLYSLSCLLHVCFLFFPTSRRSSLLKE